VRLTFTARVFATQGLDLVASQLADAPEGDADCDVCGASGNEDAMILCDGCDRGCVYDNATRERARENYLDRSDARSGRESARAAREGAANARVGDG
jgi:histone demethylase JARID1